MNDLDNLIEYLRLERRYDKAMEDAGEDLFYRQLSYLEDNEDIVSITQDELFNETIYKDLYGVLQYYNAEQIYLWETGTGRKYYIKTGTGTYLDLDDYETDTPPQDELQGFPVLLPFGYYYYHNTQNRVIIAGIELQQAIVFNDVIDFDPESEYLKDIQTGTYDHKFKTHKMRFAGDGITERPGFMINEVKVFKNTRKDEINLIPVMEFEFGCTYKLWYLYHDRSGYRPSFGIRERDCALMLDFGSIGGLLSFLDATLFSQGFDISNCSDDTARDNFRDSFDADVLGDLRYKLGSGSELYFMDAMEMLYFLPPTVADDISLETWWKLAQVVIKKEALTTSRMLKEELFFIKLLDILMDGEDPKENERWQKEFIRILCETTDRKRLALEYLCGALDGEDYKRFLKIVNRAWRASSSFIDPGNTLYGSSDGPFILPYESEKTIGFFTSNTKAYFDENKGKARMIHVEFKTERYDDEGPSSLHQYQEGGTEKRYETEDFWYHPFHPVYLVNIGQQETAMKLDAIVPAFMLKANHDAQFWSNVMTGAEYAFDVVSTLSGIGNIGKFRYLTRLVRLAEGVEALNKTRKAVNILRYVKGVSGVISLTFGTTSAMLKLTGLRDTELGNAIWEFLFYLELLSLGGDLTASMLVSMRKSAGKILAHEEALRKTARTVEETAEIERVIIELEGISLLNRGKYNRKIEMYNFLKRNVHK